MVKATKLAHSATLTVDGLIRLMETPDDDRAVNLGNPVEFTIRQLAETVIGLTDHVKIVFSHCLRMIQQRCSDIRLAQNCGWGNDTTERRVDETIDYFSAYCVRTTNGNLARDRSKAIAMGINPEWSKPAQNIWRRRWPDHLRSSELEFFAHYAEQTLLTSSKHAGSEFPVEATSAITVENFVLKLRGTDIGEAMCEPRYLSYRDDDRLADPWRVLTQCHATHAQTDGQLLLVN
jgi:hypothetical protein